MKAMIVKMKSAKKDGSKKFHQSIFAKYIVLIALIHHILTNSPTNSKAIIIAYSYLEQKLTLLLACNLRLHYNLLN